MLIRTKGTFLKETWHHKYRLGQRSTFKRDRHSRYKCDRCQPAWDGGKEPGARVDSDWSPHTRLIQQWGGPTSLSGASWGPKAVAGKPKKTAADLRQRQECEEVQTKIPCTGLLRCFPARSVYSYFSKISSSHCIFFQWSYLPSLYCLLVKIILLS